MIRLTYHVVRQYGSAFSKKCNEMTGLVNLIVNKAFD